MPFISNSGRHVLSQDAKLTKFNPQTGKADLVFRQGKYNKPLQLTNGGDFVFNSPRSWEYNELIYDGSFNIERKYWETDVIYRVTTNRMKTDELIRFYKFFRQLYIYPVTEEGGNISQALRNDLKYIPDFMDAEVKRTGTTKRLHLPVWLLTLLMNDGFINSSILKPSVRQVNAKCFESSDDYKEFLNILEDRKEEWLKIPEKELALIKELYKECIAMNEDSLEQYGYIDSVRDRIDLIYDKDLTVEKVLKSLEKETKEEIDNAVISKKPSKSK